MIRLNKKIIKLNCIRFLFYKIHGIGLTTIKTIICETKKKIHVRNIIIKRTAVSTKNIAEKEKRMEFYSLLFIRSYIPQTDEQLERKRGLL